MYKEKITYIKSSDLSFVWYWGDPIMYTWGNSLLSSFSCPFLYLSDFCTFLPQSWQRQQIGCCCWWQGSVCSICLNFWQPSLREGSSLLLGSWAAAIVPAFWHSSVLQHLALPSSYFSLPHYSYLYDPLWYHPKGISKKSKCIGSKINEKVCENALSMLKHYTNARKPRIQ